jgi:hexosaminidase
VVTRYRASAATITKMVVYNKAPLAAVGFTGTNYGYEIPGIAGHVCKHYADKPAAVIDTGIAKSFQVANAAFKKAFGKYGVVYTGYLNVDADGTYGFSTQSYNGSMLYVDDLPCG